MRAVMFFFLLRGLAAMALRKNSQSVQQPVALKTDPNETEVYRHLNNGTSILLNPLGVVAGHAFEAKKPIDVMFQGGGQVYKPYNAADERSWTENNFYNETNRVDGKGDCLKQFLPAYGGVHMLYKSSDGRRKAIPYLNGAEYMVLEDITNELEHPNIIDLKMGTRIYSLNAKADKIERQIKSYPQQAEFGFRITGAKLWNSTTEDYDVQEKKWGPSLKTPQLVKNGLKWFFGKNTQNLGPLVHELQELRTCMSMYSAWEFIGSSLLIAYDDVNPQKITMRAIDFAYATKREEKPKSEPDEILNPVLGYVKGLDTLTRFLQEIQ